MLTIPMPEFPLTGKKVDIMQSNRLTDLTLGISSVRLVVLASTRILRAYSLEEYVVLLLFKCVHKGRYYASSKSKYYAYSSTSYS